MTSTRYSKMMFILVRLKSIVPLIECYVEPYKCSILSLIEHTYLNQIIFSSKSNQNILLIPHVSSGMVRSIMTILTKLHNKIHIYRL